ncbi:radical SAM protein [Pyxidicoccus xibeiensis]|uniref:radical SAM protein n=1 Tax=Pyxidicoccus xibeiensis TaxID=2906759 RepID=UPI0020A71412|nr:radical SAM protein [Pyxidicoccus xibeiensis]MCP3143882.1 radical SAM protein [Pyxidicoccus xibeiensis]
MSAARPLPQLVPWESCRALTCSVLPVRLACNLRCPFCFSRSSISALQHEKSDLLRLDLARYYRDARERGATRLVITGGGEPLLRPELVLHLVREGRRFFDELALFTNGTFLTRALAEELAEAGLSYVCWSRHAVDDADNRALMGKQAPLREAFLEAAKPLKVRATCVMAKGHVDGREEAWRYIRALAPLGVREFTFKHTYVAYEQSVFRESPADKWAREHQVEEDVFEGQGQVVGRLPWGPVIRRMEEVQVCYYREPTPQWEQENGTCRSLNLLSDGSVYASLEDSRSLLYRLSD